MQRGRFALLHAAYDWFTLSQEGLCPRSHMPMLSHFPLSTSCVCKWKAVACLWLLQAQWTAKQRWAGMKGRCWQMWSGTSISGWALRKWMHDVQTTSWFLCILHRRREQKAQFCRSWDLPYLPAILRLIHYTPTSVCSKHCRHPTAIASLIRKPWFIPATGLLCTLREAGTMQKTKSFFGPCNNTV